MNKRPILVLLTSSWISMLGAALVTLAGFSWLFVLPLNVRGSGVSNPYIGLLLFIAIPIVFFAGLALIPIGIALAKRKVAEKLNEVEDRRTAWRRVGIFFAVMTVANVVIASQLSYRAVEQMDTVQFCGADLPRHEARVHRACRHAAASGRGLRGVPHRSRSHRLVPSQDERHHATRGGGVQQLSPAHRVGDGEQ